MKLRAVEILPGEPAREIRIDDSLDSLQGFVDGLIQVTYPFDDNVVIVSNDEAKLMGMPGNRHIGRSIYAGPMLIVGETYNGGFCDLTDAQVRKYLAMFRRPEQISDEEVQDDMGFTIISL